MRDRFDIQPVGDGALIALLDAEQPDAATVRRARSIAARVRARLPGPALDVVPAYASVLVRFDPLATPMAYVMAVLRGAAEEEAEVHDQTPRRFRIGVRFGDEHGEDLERTARECGLSAKKYVDQFCRAEYEVAFLGFLAGFPYLIGLPQALAAPRLPTPRDRVPQGSVAIAALQCGIYPRVSPGGWRLLGLTSAKLFDPTSDRATLLLPGDGVRFASVGKVWRFSHSRRWPP